MLSTSTRPLFPVLACLLPLVAACQGSGSEGTDTPTYPPNDVEGSGSQQAEGASDVPAAPVASVIEFSTQQLHFGEVELGASKRLRLSLTNTSDVPLDVAALQIEGSSSFRVEEGPVDGGVVAPGSTVQIILSYNPTTDEDASAMMTIYSDDPAGAQSYVLLDGSCLAPRLELLPSSVDFRQALENCPISQVVAVMNAGRKPLTVTRFDLATSSSDEVSFEHSTPLPITLQPGQLLSGTVEYRATDLTQDYATLVIESDDPSQPSQVLPVHGQGREPTEVTQTYYSGTLRPVDVLLVVDNSGSMCDEQAILADSLKEFITIVDSMNLDYHIGVVDVENPWLEGEPRFITPETPDHEEVFFNNAFVGCHGRRFIEQGLMVGTNALYTQKYLSRSGFFREEAALRVLFISDEPEQSPFDVAAWVEALQLLKGDPDDVVLSAVAGDPGTGCISETGTAGDGSRYALAADLTGGGFASICESSFMRVAEQMAWDSLMVYTSRFPLTSRPAPETLSVTVDGVPVPHGEVDGWTYDDLDQALVLHGAAIPTTYEAPVVITYQENEYCRADLEPNVQF